MLHLQDDVTEAARPEHGRSTRGRRGVRGRGGARGRGVARARRVRPVDDANRQLESQWQVVDDSGTLRPASRFRPAKPPGIQSGINHETSVIETFRTLFTDKIFDDLTKFINEYAVQKTATSLPARRRSVIYQWRPVTINEMKKFLAVLIAMGITKRPTIKDYWTINPVEECSWYSQMFPRERFEAIYHTMLHVSSGEAEGKEKIEPFLNDMVKNFQASYYPYENLAIDEMVIGYNGRWKNKQYNASKPKKYHIKTFGLCDSVTGFVYNILMYFGSNTSYNPELDPNSLEAIKVFEYLLRDVGPGHHIYADRYYTSLNLIRFLQTKYFH